MRRTLRVALVYALLFSGLLFLLSDWLCTKLYGNAEAANQLRLYALLIPMLYCDLLTDAMTKGLGQQKICVRYNIITSFLDVVFLYLLLPRYGMLGYYASFLVTHLLNFILSLRRLLMITEEKLSLRIPLLAAASCLFSLQMCSLAGSTFFRGICYPVVLGCTLFLLGVLRGKDVLWIRGLLKKKTSP